MLAASGAPFGGTLLLTWCARVQQGLLRPSSQEGSAGHARRAALGMPGCLCRRLPHESPMQKEPRVLRGQSPQMKGQRCMEPSPAGEKARVCPHGHQPQPLGMCGRDSPPWESTELNSGMNMEPWPMGPGNTHRGRRAGTQKGRPCHRQVGLRTAGTPPHHRGSAECGQCKGMRQCCNLISYMI